MSFKTRLGKCPIAFGLSAYIMFFVTICFFVADKARAQNTGGVFGPVVNEGQRLLQYRIAYAPEDGDLPGAFVHRLHYDHALNDDFLARIVVQGAGSEEEAHAFDMIQGEVFWEFSDDEDWWKRGIRFDARFRDHNRPNQIGLNFMNEFDLSEEFRARFLVLTVKQFGDQGADGVLLETRAHLEYRTGYGINIGVETFNPLGEIGDFTDFDDSAHQIGPYATVSLDDDWQLFTGVLFGASRGARDTDFRFWVTRVF